MPKIPNKDIHRNNSRTVVDNCRRLQSRGQLDEGVRALAGAAHDGFRIVFARLDTIENILERPTVTLSAKTLQCRQDLDDLLKNFKAEIEKNGEQMSVEPLAKLVSMTTFNVGARVRELERQLSEESAENPEAT